MANLRGLRSTLGLLAIVVLISSRAHALPIQITIDTSSLAGMNAALAFDLINGGPPANSMTISGFASNGTLGAGSSTGGVTGAFPGTVTIMDTAFFNEY